MVEDGEKALVLPYDPEEFVRYCREYLKLSAIAPFDNFHLQKLAEDFRLTPVAFYNSGAHWILVTSYDFTNGRLRYYNPAEGLREIAYGSAQRVWYFLGDSRLKLQAADLSLDKYRILEEPLDQLGPIQRPHNPYDCGPLAVFAARLSRGVERGNY